MANIRCGASDRIRVRAHPASAVDGAARPSHSSDWHDGYGVTAFIVRRSGNATLLGLGFTKTDPSKLGIGEHAERHLPSGRPSQYPSATVSARGICILNSCKAINSPLPRRAVRAIETTSPLLSEPIAHP